jgi:hypothetical protein
MNEREKPAGVRMKTYIVEPQLIFVPDLVQVLSEAGATIVRVRDVLDPLDILRIRPNVLFYDDEGSSQDAMQVFRFLFATLSELTICLYAGSLPAVDMLPEQDRSRLIFIPKSATREALIEAIQQHIR